MYSSNRRQFERLEITEHAVAVNEKGLQLGPVTEASGGGMLVTANNAEALALMPVGRKMRVTVVEPNLGTANTLDVEVLYIHGNSVGMKFIQFA